MTNLTEELAGLDAHADRVTGEVERLEAELAAIRAAILNCNVTEYTRPKSHGGEFRVSMPAYQWTALMGAIGAEHE